MTSAGQRAVGHEIPGAEQTFVVLKVPAGLQLGDGQGAPTE